MAGPREQSMEDILASIKRVIAEEKEIRAASTAPAADDDDHHDDVLELDEMVAEEVAIAVDLGPPLMEDGAASSSRQRLEQLASVASAAPPVNPMEDMVREMMRPLLKQWLDENLPRIVDEHVKREIHRITGKPV